MTLLVKICGLRDAETVAAAIEAGADAVGFVFADSPRRVSVEDARRAARSVPGSVRRVAVMRHPTKEEWAAVRDGFEPDVLQTDANDFAGLDVPPHIASWPVLREGMPMEGPVPTEFVYEGPVSGAGETVDWKRAAMLARKGRMVLAGGLDAGNVGNAIRHARPWGVDVSSGVESAPGEKDVEKIRLFIGAVRTLEKER